MSLKTWIALVGAFCMAAAVHAAPGAAQDPAAATKLRTAVFAGGCFWCVEEAFDKVPGVTDTTSGYTGGKVVNPTYEEVVKGGTAHVEAVMVRYDSSKVTYEALLDVFWRNIDPFDSGGQFCDRGESYRSVIFYNGERQRVRAEQSMKAIEAKLGKPVATALDRFGPFYPAETYHQNFHQENPLRYKLYKWRCGRAARLEEVWGKPDEK
jgi:peptide-methionine (S)-S-oxide reductase